MVDCRSWVLTLAERTINFEVRKPKRGIVHYIVNVSVIIMKIKKNIIQLISYRWIQNRILDPILANKISLNSKKTEMIIFQKPGFKLNWDWNVRLNGYKLHLSDQIKYLGIFLDRFLNCHYQSNLLVQKLARALGMLSKVRYYVLDIELKNIYYTIFESQLRFGCQIWIQSNSEFFGDKYENSKRNPYKSCHF